MKRLLILFLSLSFLWSCAPKQYSAIILPETEFRQLDTLVVSAPGRVDSSIEPESYSLPIYNPSQKRELDLIHTKLDLRFDWEKEQVLGKATLTIRPYFYSTDRVVLDAKNFKFHRIQFEGQNSPLKYDYDGQQVSIDLGGKFNRTQEFKLYIEYTATPKETSGSSAISSNRGLFFINPGKEDPNKPQQIWSQGETEYNSSWFPTIDKPNERCTGEITLTVEDRFKTLSNGLLVSSKKNSDGTRTDYWKMDLPHAPYLFMIAIGEYAVVKDTWNGIAVDYYVEPKFKEYARDIFPHTPEMLQFFSDLTGVPYPWQKFSQIVVRDYVSGAMENTTAVVFGEFVQRTKRDLVDNLSNEGIVAHEMFHHWFGDLVTCESWANVTLNEGFANYSEYLWTEHKHGKDEADFGRSQELKGYLQAASSGIHPLINFGYKNKEDMFDSHSYNKGGLVLHMLRNYVGDEAFSASLKKYLADNKFTAVEGHELRLAFEAVTGEDLNWFFNQWFYEQGQPELNVDYDYDDDTHQVIVYVEQIQDPTEMPPIFELPLAIDLYSGGKAIRHNIRINERRQVFKFNVDEDPDLIVFDADGVLLGKINEEKSLKEYIFQYEHANNFIHRMNALDEISNSDAPIAQTVLNKALSDKFWAFRLQAIKNVELNDQNSALIAAMAESDPHSNVRVVALSKLAETGDKKYAPLVARVIEKDPANKVVASGLGALLGLDKEAALKMAKKLEKEDSEGLITTVASIYAEAGDPANLPFFEEKFDKIGGYAQFSFLQEYAKLAAMADENGMLRAANKIKTLATSSQNMFWIRYMSTKIINDLHASLVERMEAEPDAGKLANMLAKDREIVDIIQSIKAWETDERVNNMCQGFPDPSVERD